MNKRRKSEQVKQVANQKMLSPVFPKLPFICSDWTTLPHHLKHKIIYYLPPTSFHQVVELCNDAQCGATEYQTLFEKADFRLPADASLVTDEDWKRAYTDKCVELRDVLANLLKSINNFYRPDVIDPEWKNHKIVMLAAISQDGMKIEDASNELKNDRDVVLAAVKEKGHSLYYASEELQKDPEIVIAAVTENGLALEYISEELQNNKELYNKIVLAAVTENGLALRYASKELQNDEEKYKEIVLAAVAQDAEAFNYVPDELKEDREIILAAEKQNLLMSHQIFAAFRHRLNTVAFRTVPF